MRPWMLHSILIEPVHMKVESSHSLPWHLPNITFVNQYVECETNVICACQLMWCIPLSFLQRPDWFILG